MFHPSPIVLNTGKPAGIQTEGPLDVALTGRMSDVKTQFIDPEAGRIRYQDMKGSKDFEGYRDLAAGLRSFDLRSLAERKQKLAFWINIYNSAVIDGVIELRLERSVKEFPRFFDRVSYDIGGFLFSLNEMEHGILRGNRRPPYRLRRPFRSRDPRYGFAIVPPDPRVHFALVCGARSCPPIAFYEAQQLDLQLDLAALSFINSPQVKILPERRSALISMIFKWYKTDFGGSDEALVDLLLKYLDEGRKKDFLRDNRDLVRIRYQPYDWDLNG
ncbi:MAG: hypothetical protein A2170_07140 [Deltaproteobacteria bacterium RBG_13_53_10]|nr:MAG: hypothetical protein A2170_07140 [Deltaproteobacteria bacterium RBG_13_53_10]